MKNKEQTVADLEAELVRLNGLVRARRQQLARLEKCPNKDCECRAVWREQVEKNLARQMGKIRRQVKTAPQGSKPARGAAKRGKR